MRRRGRGREGCGGSQYRCRSVGRSREGGGGRGGGGGRNGNSQGRGSGRRLSSGAGRRGSAGWRMCAGVGIFDVRRLGGDARDTRDGVGSLRKSPFEEKRSGAFDKKLNFHFRTHFRVFSRRHFMSLWALYSLCTVDQNNLEYRLKYWATPSSVCSFARTAHSFACS